MKYRVTIVSAYYGNRDMTQKFMDTLKDNISEQDRVILVSAGNEPNTGEIVWNYPAHWDYLVLHKNIGFANSMNTGITKALEGEQDYICILGNDGFPTSKDWLDKLIETQVTEGTTITCPEPSRPSIDSYNHLKLKARNNLTFYQMFPAICWLIPESAIRTVGLFDERFKLGCYEDNDYCMRVRRWGGTIVVDHKVKLDHLLSQTFGKLDRPDLIMAENGRLYNEKWKGKV